MGISEQSGLAWEGDLTTSHCICPVTCQAPGATIDSRKRSRYADQELDDNEEDSRPSPPVVLRDVPGKTFVVSKYSVQLMKATQSIVLRPYVSEVDRQVMFPQAYAHGPGMEALEVYQEHDTILKAAEERLQRASGQIGVREMLRSRSMCMWGKQTDKTFLTNLTLWILTGFDSLEEKRLCMEHYSPCGELTDCIRNMLTTYDELWGLDWKRQMEPLMVQYFEDFGSRHRLELCCEDGHSVLLPDPARHLRRVSLLGE